MRKTLLIAAASLAASIISSQAGVYSQNVVGYANTVTPSGGTFLTTVPFKVGVSNGANEVWPLVGGLPTIPDGSAIELWNGSKFITDLSDSGSGSLWDDNLGSALTYSPILPVGQGFFLIPAGDTTNTFAGGVAVLVGTSNQVSFLSGGTYLVAAAVPYAGAITNGNPITGAGGPGLSSLNGLPDGSLLELWNGSKFTTYQSDSGSPSFWDDNLGSALLAPPNISVAQSFFLIPAGPWTWQVGL